MDILVKNIELPPMGKQICLWVMHNGTVWHEDARDMIPTVMEAIPVPEHGRLIDADRLLSTCFMECASVSGVMCKIKTAPTVLEATE